MIYGKIELRFSTQSVLSTASFEARVFLPSQFLSCIEASCFTRFLVRPSIGLRFLAQPASNSHFWSPYCPFHLSFFGSESNQALRIPLWHVTQPSFARQVLNPMKCSVCRLQRSTRVKFLKRRAAEPKLQNWIQIGQIHYCSDRSATVSSHYNFESSTSNHQLLPTTKFHTNTLSRRYSYTKPAR